MARRASLPGAAELFRSTGTGGPAVPEPVPAEAQTPAERQRRSSEQAREPRGPSGRQRHEEKITVYCSAQELLDLESARLALRAEHGIAVDRGRIVREALAVVLADLQANDASSTLVQRLRES